MTQAELAVEMAAIQAGGFPIETRAQAPEQQDEDEEDE